MSQPYLCTWLRAVSVSLVAALAFQADLAASEVDSPTSPVGLAAAVDEQFGPGQPVAFITDQPTPQLRANAAGWLQQQVEAQFASARQPTVDPVQPVQPGIGSISPNAMAQNRVDSTAGGGFGSGFDLGIGSTAASVDPARTAIAQSSGAASVIRGSEAIVRQTSDAGDLLGKSFSSPGVYLQRRNPIVNSPFIRGYRAGQYITQMNGAYWFPARQDLDTALSKIDSQNIQDLIVIKGPYSSLYGPGFSYIDVVTRPSPRFSGLNSSFESTVNYQTNGNAWYGSQTGAVGSNNWGVRVSYGQRQGNDYYVGNAGKPLFVANNGRIPSSYNSRVLDTAFGRDLGGDTSIEGTFLHIDQTDVELPGEPLDINTLSSTGFTLKLTADNNRVSDQFKVETFLNKTDYNGDTFRPGKAIQFPVIGANLYQSSTYGYQKSTGFRAFNTWGDVTSSHLTLGVDTRYQTAELNEFDIFSGSAPINFPIPRAYSLNPGLFSELQLEPNDRWSIKSGARFDWVSNNAKGFIDNDGNNQNDIPPARFDPLSAAAVPNNDFKQHYNLYSGYVSGRYVINPHWTATANYGFAMRPPTFQELYAQAPFVQLGQTAFVSQIGNAELNAEKLHQIDLGVDANYENLKLGARGYQSWIFDYIGGFGSYSPSNANFLSNLNVYRNFGLATLSGTELYGEAILTRRVTSFANLGYVYGYNRELNGPLPQMYPLQSQMGLRFRDPRPFSRYGIELSARAVAQMNRLGVNAGTRTETGVPAVVVENSTPGFMTGDLRTYYRFSPSSSLTAGVTNLADRFYQEHLDNHRSVTSLGVYQPGRNFYFGADFRF